MTEYLDDLVEKLAKRSEKYDHLGWLYDTPKAEEVLEGIGFYHSRPCTGLYGSFSGKGACGVRFRSCCWKSLVADA